MKSGILTVHRATGFMQLHRERMKSLCETVCCGKQAEILGFCVSCFEQFTDTIQGEFFVPQKVTVDLDWSASGNLLDGWRVDVASLNPLSYREYTGGDHGRKRWRAFDGKLLPGYHSLEVKHGMELPVKLMVSRKK